MVCGLVLISILVGRWLVPNASGVFGSGERELPIYGVNTEQKKIAISFDAAWGDEKTQGILDILDQYQIKSTFFLVGFWVDRYPDKVKLIDQRGHEIGNHSTNHPYMSKLSKDQIVMELSATKDKIEKITGKKTILFRPPFGDYNNLLIQTVRGVGYQPIQWSVDSLDWKELGAQAMVEQVANKVKPGAIVLFHNNSKYILEALPKILDYCKKKGYEIVPISQLIYQKDYEIDRAGIQRKLSR